MPPRTSTFSVTASLPGLVASALAALTMTMTTMPAAASAPPGVDCTGLPDGPRLPDAHAREVGATAPPAAILDVDTSALHGRRIWLTVTAHNPGSEPAMLQTSFALFQRGTLRYGEPRPPLVLAPGQTDSVRLAVWMDPRPGAIDKFTAYATTAAPRSQVTIERLQLTCSTQAYWGGEPSPENALLEEALKLYADEALQPFADPAAATRFARILATGAQESDDIASAIRAVLSAYSDRHSYLYAPSRVDGFYAALAPVDPTVTWRDDVAVIAMPAGASLDSARMSAYAARIGTLVEQATRRHPRAWIVDLRGFGGGDMWAALSALSSLVGYGSVGGFGSRTGVDAWIVAPGRAAVGSVKPDPADAMAAPAFTGPVAVLIGPATMSAGEMVAVAFHGRPDTRLFGAPTAGWTNTGIEQRTLSDGSLFGIAHYRVVDRRGQVVVGAVTPDIATGADAETLAAAMSWIQQSAPGH